MNSNTEEIEIDLKEIFYVIRQKIVVILLIAMIAGIGTGVACKYFVAPKYQSTAKLFILTKSTSITSLADIQMGSSLTKDYMELIYSRPVVEKVIENQKLDEKYETLIKKVKVENPTNTRILAITVTYDEPNTAKAIVDEFAEVAKKSISAIMDTDEPNIVEQGHVNIYKVSPVTKRDALIAAILGALLSAGVFVTLYLMNDTITSSDDVEKYLGINVLASIPMGKSENGKSKKKRKNIFKLGKGRK